MTDIQPDAELVDRSLSGDSRAFAEICERHRARVWRIIASVARGPDVEDLAQEAVLRAWCALRSWRGEAPFDAWLCRIALNVAQDHQKSAWKRRVIFWAQSPQESETQDDPFEPVQHTEPLQSTAERREMQRCVRRAVAALPARQSTPIWLHYFEGFNLSEVARLEHVSESTVRSRVQAGLRRLSRTLHPLLEAEESRSISADPEGRLETDSI